MSTGVFDLGAADQVALLEGLGEGCAPCALRWRNSRTARFDGGRGRVDLITRREHAAVRRSGVSFGYADPFLDRPDARTNLTRRIAGENLAAKVRRDQKVRDAMARAGNFTRGAASLGGVAGDIATFICEAPSQQLSDFCKCAGLNSDQCAVIQCALRFGNVTFDQLKNKVNDSAFIDSICRKVAAEMPEESRSIVSAVCGIALAKLRNAVCLDKPPAECPTGTTRVGTQCQPKPAVKQVAVFVPPAPAKPQGVSTGVKVAIGIGVGAGALLVLPRLLGR